MRAKRSLLRELGNPLSMFHDKAASGRTEKWSMFRVLLFGLWLFFLLNFPSAWGPWEWAALTTIALALALRDLMTLIPVKEGFLALAAFFGAAVAKRTSSTVTVKEETMTTTDPVPAAALPVATAPDDATEPHEWADGAPDEGKL